LKHIHALLLVALLCSQPSCDQGGDVANTTVKPSASSAPTTKPTTNPANTTNHTQDQPLLNAARTQAEKLSDAMLKEDYPRIIATMSPQVVAAGGGAEKMNALIKKVMQEMRANGMAFEEIKLGQPQSLLRGKKHYYTFVPLSVTMQSPKGRMLDETNLLASSQDSGATWTYVDCAGLDEASLRQLFPDFPTDQHLPVKKPAQFIR
jgi:hypothetical protein